MGTVGLDHEVDTNFTRRDRGLEGSDGVLAGLDNLLFCWVMGGMHDGWVGVFWAWMTLTLKFTWQYFLLPMGCSTFKLLKI